MNTRTRVSTALLIAWCFASWTTSARAEEQARPVRSDRVVWTSRSSVVVHPSGIEVTMPVHSSDKLQEGEIIALYLIDAHGSNTSANYLGVVGKPFVGAHGLLYRRVTFPLKGAALPYRVDRTMLGKSLAAALPIDKRFVSFHDGAGQPWHSAPAPLPATRPKPRFVPRFLPLHR